jgi:hypothetical protein
MPQKVTVADAKPKSNHVKIWDDGAKRADHPNAFCGARAVETRTDPEGRDSMGEHRRHRGPLL